MRTSIAILLVCFAVSPVLADSPRAGLALGVDVGARHLGDHDQGTSTLLSIGGEIYGPRGSALADLGVVVDLTATLVSADMSSVILADSLFGSPSWTGGLAAVRARVQRSRSEAGLSLGVGTIEYSLVERDILAITAARADVTHYARVAIDGRIHIARAAVFGALGARGVLGGNTDADAGFDAELGVAYRVLGPLELRASGMVEEFREIGGEIDPFGDRAWRAGVALAADWR